MRPRRRLLLVGGGTVGHLAPGFALAEVLAERGIEALFATPGERTESHWFPAAFGRPLTLPAPRLPRRGPGLLLFPFRLLAAVGRALELLARARPDAVVGLGGWPSVPGVLAARLRRVPLALIASDQSPGVAIRALAPLAGRVYLAHASARAGLGRKAHPVVTGPMLRRAILTGRREPGRFGLEAGRLTLLVVGGSLGAEALNRPVAQALARIARRRPEGMRRIQVLHVVGSRGAGVEDAYRAAGLSARVVPFLTEMGHAYATADLVLSRAGALTCAELQAARVPAVLVPYPHHKDRQQHANAEILVRGGGAALLLEEALDEEALEREVVGRLLEPDRLESMRRGLARGAADGASQMAEDLVRWLGWEPASPGEPPTGSGAGGGRHAPR